MITYTTFCNLLKRHKKARTAPVFALLVSLFFTSASFAQDATLEINPDYLNNLTPDKVTWTTVSDDEIAAVKDIVLIDGTSYKYSYNKPADYNETNTRLDNELTTSNTKSVVFKNIKATANGGAIYNSIKFDNPINADFIGNYIQATHGDGGAIYNNGTIGAISGDFIGNYIKSESSYGDGGAISNYGTIGNITGDFIGNYIQAQKEGQGGAIYNIKNATIGDITGDFIGNYVQAQTKGYGGAISNYGIRAAIGNISGDFIGNYVQAQSSGYGGAIYNDVSSSDSTATLDNITGDFIGNYVQSQNKRGYGGAISNYVSTSNSTATIGDITGDFIGNYIQAQIEGFGGAIYNEASYSSSTASIGDITGDFISNYIHAQTQGYGGAIYNYGKIRNITGDFIGNYVQGNYGDGGAIYNGGTIGDISGDFIGNYVKTETSYGYGGAIYNYGKIGDISGDFIGNYVQTQNDSGYGGAIYNDGNLSLTNANFTDNYVQTGSTDKYYVQGGAIYNTGTLNITANDGKQSVFDGNKIIYKDSSGKDIEESNAIHMASGTLNLSAIESGQIIFNDKITAETGQNNGEIDPGEPTAFSITPYNNPETNAPGIIYNKLKNKALFNYEGFFNSSSYYNNDIEKHLKDMAANSWYGTASWKFIDGKYVLTEIDDYGSGYDKYTTEFTYIDELDGYVETYISESGYFMQSDDYDGDLATYVKKFVEFLQTSSYVSYYEKDGVYYITETYTDGSVRYYTYTEDKDAGGAWYSEKYNEDTWFETVSPEEYNGNIEKYLTDIGYSFVEKEGIYYAYSEWGGFIKINQNPQGYISQGQYFSEEDAKKIFAEAKANGQFIAFGSNNVMISDKEIYAGESGFFHQDDNGNVLFYNILASDIDFNLTGDGTGKIVFNNDIEHDGIINVEKIEVDVNAQGFDRANLQTGATVNVGTGGLVKDTLVNQSSLLNIKDGGRAMSSMVTNGGKLVVQTGGLAENTVVFTGGRLEAQTQARLNNLLAQSGSELNISASSILSGNIIIDKQAILSGNYDYSTIFIPELKDTGSITFIGGLNDVVNEDTLVNTSANKILNLASGDYLIGGNKQAVAGWSGLTLSDDAMVKLEGVIEMSDAAKPVNITSGSKLDVSGRSPLVTTIVGSLNNDGVLNFHHDEAGYNGVDDADDIINIHGNYKAFATAEMFIDVNPNTGKSDLMIVDGDVEGSTKVTIYKVTSGDVTDIIKFVDAPNDDTSTGASFTVNRVYGDATDPSNWKIVYNNNAWYVGTTSITGHTPVNGYGTTTDEPLDASNPPNVTLPDNFPSNPTIPLPQPQESKEKLVSEAVAYMALPQIGLEQTRDLVRIVSNKVASTKTLIGHCGMSECEYDGQNLHGAWINVGQTKSNLEAPMSVEAKIKAVDLGFDIQQNLNNRLGIFGSYRQGNYDLSGDGKDYYSSVSSEFDIDSWILGLYHRYDKDRIWTMSTLYGGIQQVDLTTDDDVSSDTQGIQFGASIEAGVVFEPLKRLTVEPSIRLGYNFIKYDEMSDNYGKTAEFDNVNNIEAEVGVKVEKTFFHDNKNHSISKIYVKPSIVQNFGKGDVNITSLNSVEGIENQTLIRGELGGSFNFGNGWSGFGAVGYTFGCDYDATDFNLGINYNW